MNCTILILVNQIFSSLNNKMASVRKELQLLADKYMLDNDQEIVAKVVSKAAELRRMADSKLKTSLKDKYVFNYLSSKFIV